jgi:hypothetical protein
MTPWCALQVLAMNLMMMVQVDVSMALIVRKPLPSRTSWRRPILAAPLCALSLQKDDDESSTETTSQPPQGSDSTSRDPQVLFTSERRAELFQYLLRDLQIEGVPILSVDLPTKPSPLQRAVWQAALWTTMAELYVSATTMTTTLSTADPEENQPDTLPSDVQKVCFVLEHVPVEHLQRWVDDFALWQGSREPYAQHLEELSMFQISLVGNGMGPAILITTNSPGLETVETSGSKSTLEEEQMIKEMHRFMERVLPTRDDTDARHPTTPQSSSRQIFYRVCYFRDACHIMSAFWNAVCELGQQQPAESDWHIILLMPNVDQVVTRGPHGEKNVDRWTAMARLQEWFFCLYANAATTESSAPRMQNYGSRYVEDKPTLEEIRLEWQQHWSKVRQKDNPMVAGLLNGMLDGLSDKELQEIVHEARRSPVPAVRLSRSTPKHEKLALVCCIGQMLQSSLQALRPKLPHDQSSVKQE